MDPPASIVIPTRERLGYLEVALASIAPQAQAAGAEVLVVDDADTPSARARSLAERHGARYEHHEGPRGLNGARNTGVSRSRGELVVFVDDDIRARPGWLAALLEAASSVPGEEVLAGRIVARFEGRAPRGCGRELPPITTLDIGERDGPTPFAWGANMAIRRSALRRVGPFEAGLSGGGDEQEWQERREWNLGGSRPGARYVAGALVEHRRQGDDALLGSLCRAARARGRAARRFDVQRGRAPRPARELLTLAACIGHVIRRRCPAGLTMVAHSAGRVEVAMGGEDRPGEARKAGPGAPVGDSAGAPGESGPSAPGTVGPASPSSAEDFLSGASGTVGGLDRVRRRGRDGLTRVGEVLSGRDARLARAARHAPPRRKVLALSVVRPERAEAAAAIAERLLSSRHAVELHTTEPGHGGKFENLNRLLAEHPLGGHDWLLLVDDDVELPRGFLDRLLFLAERFSLTLAQPAHALESHAAWAVTRRRSGSVVRETSFVEIGPVTAFARRAFPVLLPFPELQMGWGLDLHWAALAREQGWRCGIVDAVAIRHRLAPAAAGYLREQAMEEAREFLAARPYIRSVEAEATLTTHTSW